MDMNSKKNLMIYHLLRALAVVALSWAYNVQNGREIPSWWYFTGFAILFTGFSLVRFKRKEEQ
jgi:hypothetical protein